MNAVLRGLSGFMGSVSPVRAATLGYLLYAIAGWLILCLPIAHTSVFIPCLDNLFTAVSALSTTGLVTTSTGNSYTLFGQIIILLLIQIGGIGYMTFGSFVILSRTGKLPERRCEIGKAVFTFPAEMRIEHMIRSVIVFTVIIESAGAVALYFAFRHAGAGNLVWSSIFHSVSSFCTAGFSLYDNSLEGYRADFWLNAILSVLSYLGAIGFIICLDVWRRVTSQSDRITLTSKIIVFSTFWISIIGTILFFFREPSIQALAPGDRLISASFQVMSALTTVGFNSIPISQLSQASLFLLILLMVIGASPSGTGGGLKTTTFSAIIGVMKSALRGSDTVFFWGREIPPQRVWLAMASLGFYCSALIAGCYLLSNTEPFTFEALLFEAASALGTVGLSTGITAQLSPLGKLTIILLMFVGRVGPLAFGVSLFCGRTQAASHEQEDIAI